MPRKIVCLQPVRGDPIMDEEVHWSAIRCSKHLGWRHRLPVLERPLPELIRAVFRISAEVDGVETWLLVWIWSVRGSCELDEGVAAAVRLPQEALDIPLKELKGGASFFLV